MKVRSKHQNNSEIIAKELEQMSVNTNWKNLKQGLISASMDQTKITKRMISISYYFIMHFNAVIHSRKTNFIVIFVRFAITRKLKKNIAAIWESISISLWRSFY